jgi:hypothetical protein
MAASSTRNHLLNALPADLVARLSPHFHVTTLAVRKTLMAPNAKVEAAYFVESGWVSLVQSRRLGGRGWDRWPRGHGGIASRYRGRYRLC